MSRPRFTIAGMLAAVALVGVSFAALREPTDAWDCALLGVIVMTLLTSVLLAVHRHGERRAFWFGFALFGWAYLVACLIPPIEARLPTTKALVAVRGAMPGPGEDVEDYVTFTTDPASNLSPAAPNPAARWDVVVYSTPGTSPSSGYFKRLVGLPGESSGNFVRIGHSLSAMVLALVGGMISRRLHPGPGITRRPSQRAVPGVGGRDDRGGPGKLADGHGTPPRML